MRELKLVNGVQLCRCCGPGGYKDSSYNRRYNAKKRRLFYAKHIRNMLKEY